MIYVAIISVILFACLGAVLSRLDGGWGRKMPEWVDKIGVTFPYAIIGFMLNPWLAIPCLAGAWAGRATGHGGFMDLGTNPKLRDKETLEFLISPFRSRLPLFWYDFLGLAITGLAVTLIPAICLAVYGHRWLALIMVISGLMKAPSYAVDRGNTEVGEFTNGFQQFLHAGVVIWGLYAASV